MKKDFARIVERKLAIQSILSETALTRYEIADMLGVKHGAMNRTMMKLRNEMHIAEWRKTAMRYVEAFRWGPGEDAQKPEWTTYVELDPLDTSDAWGKELFDFSAIKPKSDPLHCQTACNTFQIRGGNSVQ